MKSIRSDQDEKIIVGYKDVKEDEFWIRGHLPATPHARRHDVRGGGPALSYYSTHGLLHV